MNMPEPKREGPVVISWRQSIADPRKLVTTFEVDWGKTEMTPGEAAEVTMAIVMMLRAHLEIKLPMDFKDFIR